MKGIIMRWLSTFLAVIMLISPLALAEDIALEQFESSVTAGFDLIDNDNSESSAYNIAISGEEEISAKPVDNEVPDEEATIPVLDVEPSVNEINDTDLVDLSDGEKGDSSDPVSIDNEEKSSFDQTVEIEGVSLRLTAEAGTFPEGSALHAAIVSDDSIIEDVTAALELEGGYSHILYRIEVQDANGSIVLPYDRATKPFVHISGIDIKDGIHVACYDASLESAFEMNATIEDSAIEFAYEGTAVYDLVMPQVSDDDSSLEEHIEDEPSKQEPGEDGAPENGQTGNSEDQSGEEAVDQSKDDDKAEKNEESEDGKKADQSEDDQNSEDKPKGEEEDDSDEGEWMKTRVEKLDDGTDLDVLYGEESSKLTDGYSLFAAESVGYVTLPSILYVGDVYDLRNCLLFAEYNPSDVISWKSSKPKVIRIKNGMLTALKPGSAKITVKTTSGAKRKLSLSIRANSIGGLFSKPSKSDAVALGNAFSIRPASLKFSGTKLVAKFYLLNGSKKTIKAIRGLNLSVLLGTRTNIIASQSFSKVRVKGKKKGISTFTVTFSGSGVLQNGIHLSDYPANLVYFGLDTSSIYGAAGKATIPFVATVIPNIPLPVMVSSIALSNSEVTLGVGKTARLTAAVSPDNAENKGINWSSNNPGVATVNGDGLVTAVSEGEATISATAADGSGVSASCAVKVANENIQATSIEFNQIPTITVGQTATITATLSPVNVSNSQLEYKLTKSGIVELTQEPTTSGNKTIFNIRALSEGSTKLSVRTTDGSNLSASCTIYVVNPEFRFIVNNESNTILSTGDTSGSTSIVSGATNKYKYTLNIDSSHSWSVSATDTSWMTLSKTTGSAGQSDLVLILKNISSGQKYSTILTFTVNGTTRDLTVKLNKSDKLDKAVITDICRPAYNTVRLEWTAVDNAEGFKVWRRKGDDMGYIATLTASQLNYEDTGLPNGKYRYSITAYKGATESDSDEKTIIVYSANDEIIPAPSVTVSNAGSGALTISWNKTKDYYEDEVASYKAYRSTSQNGPYTLIKTLDGYNSNTFTDSGLTNGTKYFYRVAALSSGASQSVLSAAVSGTSSGSASPTVPDAPTNVSATAQSSSSILVTWKKSNSSNATGYKVYYGTNSSSGSATWFNNKTYDSNTTSVTITGLSSGTKYYVWVKATSTAGDSAFSSSDYDTTNGETNTVSVKLNKTSLTMNVGDTETLTATITPSSIEPSYSPVWTSSDTNVVSVGSTGKLKAVASGVATIKYTFLYTGGSAEATCSVTVVSPSSQIGTPTNVKTTANEDGSISVTWKKTTGCDGYKISYRKEGALETASLHVDGIGTQSGMIPASVLERNTEYSITVTATIGIDPFTSSNYQEGVESASVKVTTASLPGRPVNLTVSATNSGISVSWDNMTGVTGYHVRLSDGINTTKYDARKNSLSISSNSLKKGVTYSVTVTAVNNNGEEGPTSIAKKVYWNPEVLPTSINIANAPTKMNVGDSIQLKWSISPTNTDNTNVKWSSSDVSVVAVDNAGYLNAISAGSATITAKAEVNNVKESFDMTVVSNVPLAIGTPALKIEAVNPNYVGLCWSKVLTNNDEKVYYTVERAYSKNGSYTELSTGIKRWDYIDTSVSPSTTYYYRITAYATDSNTGRRVENTSKAKQATTPDAQGNNGYRDTSTETGCEDPRPSVTGVSISPSVKALAENMNTSSNNVFTARFTPSGANASVSWSSSNNSVLTPVVQSDSTITQYKTGHVTKPTEVTLTATANGKKGTATVTVYDRPSVKINGTALASNGLANHDINNGDLKITWSNAQSISYTVNTAVYSQQPDVSTDGSGNEAGRLSTNYNNYYSSGTSFTIPASSLVTGQWVKVAVCAYGTAWTVFAVHITDSNVYLQSIAITGSKNRSLAINGTLTLDATLTPSNATDKNVTWEAEDKSIVSVTGNGTSATVKGVKEGKTKVYLKHTSSGMNDYVEVNVYQPVTGVTLNSSSMIMKVGETATLTATVEPYNATNKGVTWSSSDTRVATVSNGTVTAIKEGTATIEAKTVDGNKIAKSQIYVLSDFDYAFTKESWEEQYVLQKECIIMAYDIYRGTGDNANENDYNGKIKNDFNRLEIEGIKYRKNKSEIGQHKVGYAIGLRELFNGIKLYVVVIRGTYSDYNLNEWISNFSIQKSGPASGFVQAAKEVAADLETMIKDARNSKILFTGHSRGAAVANYLAGEWAREFGFTNDNIYAYTFACPNIVLTTKYTGGGIYNYNFAGDPVTKVPFKNWNFKRYGTTRDYNLPDLNIILGAVDSNMTNDFIEILNGLSREYYCDKVFPFIRDVMLFKDSEMPSINAIYLADEFLKLLGDLEKNYHTVFIKLSQYLEKYDLKNGDDSTWEQFKKVFSYMGNTHLQGTYLDAVTKDYWGIKK